MARVNHNAQYIYDVDGETIWEKLRSIRIMLDDRRRALELSLIGIDESKSKEKDEFEKRREAIEMPFQLSLIEDCKNEIKFLEEFESYLAVEAEKTRIAGKTDDEMYEINFFHELEVRLVRKAQAQIASCGRIQDDLLLRLMKNKGALNICVQQGLLTADIQNFIDTPLLPSADVHTVAFLEKK